MLISNSFKTVHFQTFYKKFKVISLPISIILHLIPIKFETLKPPYETIIPVPERLDPDPTWA